MKTGIVVLFALISASTFSQTQFKHDLGLRIGSSAQEWAQLQYRFHPNEKWAFGATASFGETNSYDSDLFVESGDSTYFTSWSSSERLYYNLSFDAVRKLTFMKHNFYYAGASIGFGAMRRTYQSSWARYELGESDPNNPFLAPLGEEIESDRFHNISNGTLGRTRLYLGADVPILDRLTLNLEVGADFSLTRYSYSLATPQQFYLYSELIGFVSGGLRYRFGKVE